MSPDGWRFTEVIPEGSNVQIVVDTTVDRQCDGADSAQEEEGDGDSGVSHGYVMYGRSGE